MPCIVHMIRNSTKFVSYKDLKTDCRDLKEVYSAINAESGHEALEEFGKKWNDKYPMIQASWERNRNDLTEFFNYPKDIRRAIYTTNAIESLNFSLRKITRNKSSFQDDDSIYKIMYLAINTPDASIGVCCSHKVIALGFNTLCYDAERRGISYILKSRATKDFIG